MAIRKPTINKGMAVAIKIGPVTPRTKKSAFGPLTANDLPSIAPPKPPKIRGAAGMSKTSASKGKAPRTPRKPQS